MSQSVEEALAKNKEKADSKLQEQFDRIFKSGPAAVTDTDMAFLAARRSYLTEEQYEAYGIGEYLEAREAVSAGPKSFGSMNKTELQAELKTREIPFDESATKAQLIELLEAAK